VILDASALIAIALREPGHETVVEHMLGADALGIGAPTLLETGIVLTSRIRHDARPALDRFVAEFGIVPIPFVAEHWRTACAAFVRFGRGRHPAALNFGDCMAYATARLADLPLLCVGDDFRRTDLAIAH
jgi:ribonuclease VapC